MTVDQVRQIYSRIYRTGISVENPFIKTRIFSGKSEAQQNAEQKAEQQLISELSEKNQYDDSYRKLINSLCEIEEFVLEVLSSNEPAFQWIENEFGMKVLQKNQPLASYFSKVRKFSNTYTHGYILSEHVQLFFECWVNLKLGENPFDFLKGNAKDMAQYEPFNQLLCNIRDAANSTSFKKRMSRRKEKSTKRYHSATSYIDKLFDNYPKVQVIRMNLSYRHKLATGRTDMDVKNDLEKLKNNWRKKPTLFINIVGDIWALKWAPGLGLFIHLIIFSVSTGNSSGDELADNIGKYWVEVITKNFGQYLNCNVSTINDWKLGIGEIAADDNESRAKLLNAVWHLTESEEYLRAEKLGSGKLFG